ncbi:prolipoprotein diacylglyceryl transferase [Hymenobacter crusticola]|uniref:Prolipoprotein diacylglyceryl transferase n=1 Tax=Hymenobacter crusticola TaxID=1770526 RepID=A0A243W7U9_9BACT|nr:prolipoprotein diacylglyceryl transferase family protein [Hymenobacter crusticola]OUJ70896.1 hypothetical protein BXP70_23495 [Hymenobacter crusticola]
MSLGLHLLLPTPVGHYYYDVFYLLGFGVAGALLLLAAKQRQYAWRPWLVLMAGAQLLLILGTKLIAGSVADWHHLVALGSWTGPDHRSILGGLLGAILAVSVLRRWLGFGRGAYDMLALPLMVGLAVQGVGCLLTGCCFGTVAPTLPFSVAYAPGTLPFLTHVSGGLLEASAPRSLPVHPAQLYQIILCLSIAVGLLATRKQQWPAGWRFTLVLVVYVLGRFGFEFWRDVAGDVVGTGLWGYLKPVQWGLLLALPVLGSWLIYQKKTTAPATHTSQPASWRPMLTVAGLLLLTAALGPQWLTWSERGVVQSLLLVVLVLEANYLRQLRGRANPVAKLAAVLGCVAMLTMSQAPAPQEPSTQDEQRRYTTVSMGGSAGSMRQLYDYPYGCSGTRYAVPTYRQHYQIGTLDVARSQPLGRHLTVTYGAALHLGQTRFLPDQDSTFMAYAGSSPVPTFTYGGKRQLLTVNPYLEFAHPKYLRLGLGAHFGTAAYDFPYSPGKRNNVRLQFLLEGGYMPYVFLHISLNQGARGVGDGTSMIGLGSGFGHKHPRLLTGLALVNSESNVGLFERSSSSYIPFLQGNIPISAHWELLPYAATNFKHVNQLRLQVRYRLPAVADR